MNTVVLLSQWSKPISITENKSGSPLYSDIVSVKKGNVGFIWMHKNDFDASFSNILYREITDAGLTKIDTLSTTGYAWAKPKIIMAHNDKLMAIWVDINPGEKGNFEYSSGTYNVVCSIKNDGSWTKPMQLKGFSSENPVILLKKDEKGQLYILANTNDESYLLQYNGNKWMNCSRIPYDFIYSDFVITRTGTIEMAFMAPINVGDVNSIWFLSTDTTYQKWYNPILVQKGGRYYNTQLMMTDDINNKRHLVWMKQFSSYISSAELFHSISLDGNVWTLPQKIIKNKISNKSIFYPELIKLDGTKILLYWMAGVESNYSIEYVIYNGVEWRTPIIVSEKAMYPCMYNDDNGTVHFSYMNQRTNANEISQIYYMNYKLSSLDIKNIKEFSSESGLMRNYPNPFNSETVIKYKLAKSGNVKILMYNSVGQEIETLINQNVLQGEHFLRWKPKNVSSGLYYCRILYEGKSEAIKMLYLK